MTKREYLMSFICVCATVVFATDNANTETYQWQNPYFNAIGNNVTATSLDPTNGVWAMPASGVTTNVTNKKIVFDLDSSSTATFTATSGTAADTNTVTKIVGNALFYPATSTNNLPTQSGAKCALATVKENNTAYYYVHNDSGWVKLYGATPSDSAVDFTLNIDYRSGKLNVWIGDTILYAGNDSDNTNISITVGNQVAGVSVKGAGEVSRLDADIMLAVATIDTTRYGTVADAIAAAGNEPTAIDIVRDTNGKVDIPSESKVKISNNGHEVQAVAADDAIVAVEPTKESCNDGASGTFDIPVDIQGGTLVVTLPESMTNNKEVASYKRKKKDNKQVVEVVVQTASNLLAEVSLGGKNIGITNQYINTDFRAFLNKYTSLSNVYVSSGVTKDKLTTELDKVPKSNNNGLKYWQDYALGIEPTTEIKVQAQPGADNDDDAILIKIPNLIGTTKHDYTIKYKVGGEEATDPGAVKVPLTTGTYKIKISFE